MSSDRYAQGQGGKDSLHHQYPHHLVLAGAIERRDGLPEQHSSSTFRAPVQFGQRFVTQNTLSQSYQNILQDRDGQIHQQQLHLEQGHQLLGGEEKMVYANPISISQEQGTSVESSTGLDGQSLYCTEILPSASPPSQPITVEGGGTSRRGLVAVNGGAGCQPVQYTIIIADPQLQQNGNNNTTKSNNSGATSILLSTLVQQQQQQQHLQQQQQLQQHLASISKANSDLNYLTKSPGVQQQSNANLLVNHNNVNGSNKLNSLLIHNGNLSNSCNRNLGSGNNGNTSTFPTSLTIDNTFNNNNTTNNNNNNTTLDSKNIDIGVTSVSLSASDKLPAAVFDSRGVEGGIVILNYADSQLRASNPAITTINQLVSGHQKAVSNTDLVTQGSEHLNKVVSGHSTVLGINSNRNFSSSQANVYETSDSSQVNSRVVVQDTRTTSVVYNGQVSDPESVGNSKNTNSNSSQIHQTFSSGEQLLEQTSPSDRVSEGMHSGRTGTGSGQGHNNHPQQQQRHSPLNSSISAAASPATSNQAVMLSAGQPSVPSGIFRTGAENSSSPHRLSGSGSSNYIPSQYSTIYGPHGQTAGHLATMQHYSFFPGFGASGAAGHGFSHSPLMAASSQGHYPHIESYSAMLASMGNHVQHRGAQGSDRPPRVQAPGVSVPQRQGSYLPSAAHLAAQGPQYPSIPSSSHRRLSGSSSPSPGPAAATHNPQAVPTRHDPLSSHHLEKLAAIKGGTSHQGCETEGSRDPRVYGDASGLHEDKLNLSPSGTYHSSGHVPKVSFDTVVKEYGGGRDSPSGRGDSRDSYFRSSLSGKEGSMKHRILTRPSDSELGGDDLSKVSGTHGLKDEPVSKRLKFASVGSAPTYSYGTQSSAGHPGDSLRSGSCQHPVTHVTSHHSLTNSNSNTMDSRRAAHNVDNNNSISGHQGHEPGSYQHHQSEDSNSGNRYKQQPFSSSPSSSTPPSSPPTENPTSHLQYPTHFMKGSIIQLANGALKRVEDLQTEDFVSSAEISSDLKVDSSTVVRIEEHPDRGTAMLSFSVGEHRVQVTVEATLEHPFFVFGQGWSSCSVSRTLARYGLDCQKLNVGDVCISLTHKDVNLKAAEISQQQQQQQEQTYLADQHNKVATASLDSSINQIPLSTSSSAFPPPASSPSSLLSSTLSSSLKVENTDPIYPPPTSSSASGGKRRLSQTELPPPLSNIVPVKKENNSNSHNSRRRGPPKGEGEVKEEEMMEEGGDLDSTSHLRKRRWSAPDPVTVKAEQERERERQMLANEAQKAEEASQSSSSDNGH